MSKFKKYIIEIILFMTYALFAMSWKTGDILIAKYGLKASDMAIMTNAINIAKIIGSLSAAWLIAKFGNRKTFTFAALLIVLGVMIPFLGGNFSYIFVVRFILGLGGAWVLVTINPVVAKIFTGSELTVVNGLNAVAFNVGLAVVLSMVKLIVGNPILAIEIISGIILILAIVWCYLSTEIEEKGQTTNANAEAEAYSMLDGLKEKFNWVFSLSYSGLLGFYLVSFTFMKAENVKYVIYAGIVGALVGTFKAKNFTDKLQLVRVSSFLQLLSAAAFIFFYNNPNHTLVMVLGMLLGFFIFFPMSAFVTLAFTRKNVTTRKISITFSIFWAMSYFVSIILIQVFAFLKDTAGEGTAFIFIVFAEAFMFLGTTFFMKKEEK